MGYLCSNGAGSTFSPFYLDMTYLLWMYPEETMNVPLAKSFLISLLLKSGTLTGSI